MGFFICCTPRALGAPPGWDHVAYHAEHMKQTRRWGSNHPRGCPYRARPCPTGPPGPLFLLLTVSKGNTEQNKGVSVSLLHIWSAVFCPAKGSPQPGRTPPRPAAEMDAARRCQKLQSRGERNWTAGMLRMLRVLRLLRVWGSWWRFLKLPPLKT